MVEPVHQRIVDVVKARFQTIRKERGYLTDIGERVFVWRYTETNPGSEDELPYINISDFKGETEPKVSGRSDHHHVIAFDVKAQSLAVSEENLEGQTNVEADKMGRRILADIQRCIGNDFREATAQDQQLWGPRWKEKTSDTTGLAFQTLPSNDPREGGATWVIAVEQEGRTIVTVRYRFEVHYRTPRWDPFTASN